MEIASNKKKNIVAPNYLCKETLPYAADIFYHENLVYYLPIGITPQEWENILAFPQYCMDESIMLPQVVWEMQEKYFQCSKQALECCEILVPLRKRISTVATVYARDTKAMLRSKKIVKENPQLVEYFKYGLTDFLFLSREFLSHVFLDVYLEGGFKLIKEYLKFNCGDVNSFSEILISVITNRIKSLFSSNSNDNYIIYSQYWYPYVMECIKCFDELTDDDDEYAILDLYAHRLFFEIVTPVFGRCDTYDNSKYIAHVADKESGAVQELKRVCREIIENSILCKNEEVDLRDIKFNKMILDNVTEPLQYMMHKPRKDVVNFLKEFLIDSTVIGGVLNITQDFDLKNFAISAGAGIISAGAKRVFSETDTKQNAPSRLLLDGLKKNKVTYLEFEKALRKISFSNINRVYDI